MVEVAEVVVALMPGMELPVEVAVEVVGAQTSLEKVSEV
jgi:hypothetical protein